MRETGWQWWRMQGVLESGDVLVVAFRWLADERCGVAKQRRGDQPPKFWVWAAGRKVLPLPEMEKIEGRTCLPMSFCSVKFLIPFRCQMERQGWNQRCASLKFLGDPPGDQRRGYQQADGISGQKTSEITQGVSAERSGPGAFRYLKKGRQGKMRRSGPWGGSKI